jgi:hypothetical protein
MPDRGSSGKRLEDWLELVKTMWPACPAEIDRDGTGLWDNRAHAVLPKEKHVPERRSRLTYRIWPVARHAGGWSTVKIGSFYSGRHHMTVIRAIARIERLRDHDSSIDTLVDILIGSISYEVTAQQNACGNLIKDENVPEWSETAYN